MLNRDQILKASDITFDVVAVPEWGGEVRVKSLSGTEADIFQQGLFDGYGEDKKVNLVNSGARLCSLGIVDESGNKLFTEDDIVALGAKNGAAIARIESAIRKLSGLDVKSKEDIAKNSAGGQSASSISD